MDWIKILSQHSSSFIDNVECGLVIIEAEILPVRNTSDVSNVNLLVLSFFRMFFLPTIPDIFGNIEEMFSKYYQS